MLALQVYRRVVICSPKMQVTHCLQCMTLYIDMVQAKILSTVPRHLNGTSAKSLENMLLILQGVVRPLTLSGLLTCTTARFRGIH